jgi:hypothetical protein
MNARTRFICVGLVILAAAACTAPETQPEPTPPPPTETPAPLTNSEIVLNMVERLNAGDVEGSAGLFRR